MNVILELEKLNCGKVIADADLKEYTTYQSNGIADAIVFPVPGTP